MPNPYIFDRRRVRLHRDRASASMGKSDFLLKEIAVRIAERLEDFAQAFPCALDLGAHNGVLAEYIAGKNGVETLAQSDISCGMISQAKGLKVVVDEEFIPFAAESFNLVISAWSLHWVNDLPGTLIQINRILKPGGLFIAVMPGGATLKELRRSFEQAELAASGGLSPRISPFVDVRDAGSLLTRAGFAEPVADSEMLAVSYEHPLKLLHDLRNMGEANAMHESRKGFLPCSLVMLMADHYLRHFSDAHGRVSATFELVTMTGWKT